MEALIIEITTRGLHRYHEFSGEVTTIGRALDNDNSFDDATEMANHTPYSNSVNTGDDTHDYYKINLNATSTYGDLLIINFTFMKLQRIKVS